MTTSEVLKHALKSGIAMPELAVSFARILATKPHSADVVRLIGSYNLVKTTARSQLSVKTLKCDLFVRHNMLVVTKFDPRSAVLLWLKDKNRRDILPQKLTTHGWFENEQI